MRNLKINQRKMFYAQYRDKVPIVDDNGDETGDFTTGYSPPIEFYASMSAGKGNAQRDVFGTDVDFTRTISTVDLSLPINENSLVWHETAPVLLPDGSADPDSADYEVAAPRAEGLNVLVIALKSRKKNG